MLTAEEGVDLLIHERGSTEETRWSDREQDHPWASAASRWLRAHAVAGDEPDVGERDAYALGETDARSAEDGSRPDGSLAASPPVLDKISV